MNTTNLDFKILRTLDNKSIYIQDCSIYNPDLVVTCNRLDIVPPEFSTKYTFEYPLNSLISINSNAFGWSLANDYSCLTNLQDGIWEFTLSVAPNDLVYKKVYWLKTSCFRNEILSFLNENFTCEPNLVSGIEKSDYNKILLLLSEIEVAEYLASCDVQKSKLLFNALSSKFKSIKNGL